MLSIDPRRGSGDLLRYFTGTGLAVQLTQMDYGDVAFMGVGRGGLPVPVGIEVKQVGDILNCMKDGRFAGHQLKGLVQCYQDAWLLVEGDYRGAYGTGVLQQKHATGKYWFDATQGSRAMMYRDFDKWLLTQLVKGGIRYMRTYDRQETVQFIRDLYAWWGAGWDSHKSHLAQNTSMEDQRDECMLVKPSLLREIASKLPGVGWVRAGAVEAYFTGVCASRVMSAVDIMMCATEKEWAEVEGIGKGIAKKVWEALHG